ncbi:hypothetical protein ACLESD_52980, partial [Pyxidicoccus sp. 3LFB2]
MRRAKEARLAEQARFAEEARLAEEARQATAPVSSESASEDAEPLTLDVGDIVSADPEPQKPSVSDSWADAIPQSASSLDLPSQPESPDALRAARLLAQAALVSDMEEALRRSRTQPLEPWLAEEPPRPTPPTRTRDLVPAQDEQWHARESSHSTPATAEARPAPAGGRARGSW